MAHINRKQYWQIFVVLGVLTLVEVGVAYVRDEWLLVVSALVGLAIVKAAVVGWFYMHLGHETRGLKLTIAIPLAIPLFYACVLILEAGARALLGH